MCCDDSTIRECTQVLENYLKAPCPQHDDLVIAIGDAGQKIDKVGQKIDKVGQKLDHLSETTLGPNFNGRAGVVADVAGHAGDIQRLVEATGTLKRITYAVLLSVLGTLAAVVIHNYIS